MPRKHEPVRVEPGLYLAGKTYIAVATPPGSRKARKRTLGEVGLMAARRLRAEFVHELRNNPSRTAREQQPRATLREVSVAWLTHEKRLVELGELTQRTFDVYEGALRLHVLPMLGERRVQSITAEDLVEWHRRQKSAGHPANSILSRWTPLRRVLGYAVRHDLLPMNPADKLEDRERPKPGPSKQRFLTHDEMDTLLRFTPARYRDAVALGLFTGLRAGEIMGLVWDNIDFATEHIHVRYQMIRKGKRVPLKAASRKHEGGRRDVVMMPTLAAILRRRRLGSPWSQGHDLVFATSHGKTIGDRNLAVRGLEKAKENHRKAVEAALSEANRAPTKEQAGSALVPRVPGRKSAPPADTDIEPSRGAGPAASPQVSLDGVTLHVLRHTFASLLIGQGHDPVFVSRQLGHADPSITLRVYSHLFDAARHARQAREQLDAEFGGILRDHG